MKLNSTGLAMNGIVFIALALGVAFSLVTGDWKSALEFSALMMIQLNSSVAIYKK